MNQAAVGVYLKPTYNVIILVARLRWMAAPGHTIIVEVNCCRHGKSKALNEWLENNEWSDVAAIMVTNRWKNH